MTKISRNRKHLVMLPLCALFFFIGAITVHATTYYVDRLLPGSNSNNGMSESTPFLTVKKCIQTALSPGDTCLIKNGTYLDEGELALFVGGTSGNPITLKNFPGHSPIIRWSDNTDVYNRIIIKSTSAVCNSAPPGYVVIEGLELDHGHNGVKVDCGHDIIIRRNHIHDTWYSGIQIPAGFNITIDRNHIHHTGDFTGTPAPDTGLPHTHAIYITGKGYIITNNLVYDSYLYGMQLAGKPLGIAQSPGGGYIGFSGLIANNTIAYTVTRGGITLWDSGGGISNTTIENNIFHENSQTNNNSSQGIDFVSCSACIGVVRNNIWYGTSNSVVFTRNTPSGVTVTNTRNANPLMVNAPATVPASPNFHLQAESVAIDFGLNLTSDGITTDYSGRIRPASGAWEVGAYQFSDDVAAPSTPINLAVR